MAERLPACLEDALTRSRGLERNEAFKRVSLRPSKGGRGWKKMKLSSLLLVDTLIRSLNIITRPSQNWAPYSSCWCSIWGLSFPLTICLSICATWSASWPICSYQSVQSTHCCCYSFSFCEFSDRSVRGGHRETDTKLAFRCLYRQWSKSRSKWDVKVYKVVPPRPTKLWQASLPLLSLDVDMH